MKALAEDIAYSRYRLQFPLSDTRAAVEARLKRLKQDLAEREAIALENAAAHKDQGEYEDLE